MVHYRTKRNSLGWIEAVELARRANISRQAASKAMRRALQGKPWNGHTLQVRQVHSSGGTAGLRWQVKESSLPRELRNV